MNFRLRDMKPRNALIVLTLGALAVYFLLAALDMRLVPYMNDFLFWALAYTLLVNAYTLLFNKGVPNIRTEPSTRRKIIAFLKQDFAAKKKTPYTVVDLGSGNGQFTREIAREMPEANVIGIEISKKSCLWSGMLKKLYGLENLTYKNMDFFAYDIKDIDAIVFYQTQDGMESIGKKLHQELKEGALVISNRFRLGDGWVIAETVEALTLYPWEKEFHVYYQGK